MAVEIVMPVFGFSMELGMVTKWLVKVGDPVKRNDPIAEIESEKITNTANSTAEGIVAAQFMAEGDEAPCGTPLMVIAEAGEDINAVAAAFAASAEKAAKAVKEAAEMAGESEPAEEANVTARAQVLADRRGIDAGLLTGTGYGGAVTIDDVRSAPAGGGAKAADLPPIAPKALKYAEENDLDYSAVKGTGRLGLITIKDLKEQAVKKVHQAAARPSGAASVSPMGPSAQGTDVRMTSMQKTIFKSMMQSMHETAQMTQHTDADMAAAKALYQELKGKYAKAGYKLTYTAMIIKAVAMALEDHEVIRTQVVDERTLRIIDRIDIGVAVDVPGGLVVPVIREANLKDLRTICRDLMDVSERARNKQLTEADFGGAVITISNLGNLGIRYFTPILNRPESAILGTGSIIDTPVVVDGGIFVHPMLGLSLTYDHRVINGAPAARFLTDVKKNLSDFRWV